MKIDTEGAKPQFFQGGKQFYEQLWSVLKPADVPLIDALSGFGYYSW